MTIQCMIVEDEAFSRQILEDYIAESNDLMLVVTCKNAIEAREQLKEHHIDILFLDINMPEVSGITFLKSLPNPPFTVFTTAYPEFAFDGYELDVVDYLLKPFSIERFRKAVEKVKMRMDITEVERQDKRFLTVNVDKKLYRIKCDDIRYVEGCGDYVKVIYGDDSLLVHSTMRSLMEKLPNTFLRTHKSYIVNVDRISSLEGNMLTLEGEKLPVGISYREALLKVL
ncbi:response regulator transcription factor [Puteibacter caeruleilacunae]|nr:response regulator transcription factor [Puteibacter caeruleilacunae]